MKEKSLQPISFQPKMPQVVRKVSLKNARMTREEAIEEDRIKDEATKDDAVNKGRSPGSPGREAPCIRCGVGLVQQTPCSIY